MVEAAQPFRRRSTARRPSGGDQHGQSEQPGTHDDHGSSAAPFTQTRAPGTWKHGALGGRKHPRLRGTGLEAEIKPRLELGNSAVTGVTLNPATRGSLSIWTLTVGQQLRAGDMLFLYVTDHGSKGATLADNRIVLTFDGETVSLHPSIGNWGLACRSHYWIEKNKVRWAAACSQRRIEAGRAADRAARSAHLQDRANTTDTALLPPSTDSEMKPKWPAWKRLWRCCRRLFGYREQHPCPCERPAKLGETQREFSRQAVLYAV